MHLQPRRGGGAGPSLAAVPKLFMPIGFLTLPFSTAPHPSTCSHGEEEVLDLWLGGRQYQFRWGPGVAIFVTPRVGQPSSTSSSGWVIFWQPSTSSSGRVSHSTSSLGGTSLQVELTGLRAKRREGIQPPLSDSWCAGTHLAVGTFCRAAHCSSLSPGLLALSLPCRRRPLVRRWQRSGGAAQQAGSVVTPMPGRIVKVSFSSGVFCLRVSRTALA